jgi:hypothetical protein
MKQIKTCWFVFLVFLCAIFLFGCGDSGLSKGKAKDILESHLKDYYGFLLPQKVEFMGGTVNSYNFILAAKDMGLIDANSTSSIFGSLGVKSYIEKPKLGDVFSITLTEKGNSTQHLIYANKGICFLVGNRKINDIVEIKKGENDQYTVLFSYTLNYNKLGKELSSLAQKKGAKPLNDDLKLRGKAIIVYDPFLKKYIAKSIMWSKWENENWQPQSWTTYVNDKLVLMSQ